MPSWPDGSWSEAVIGYGWIVWLVCLFLTGSAVGSFLNVCIARLPLEKSLFWPSSRCGRCLTPIRWYDNLPLISYWLLRGRCRACGERFSIRYFLVELLTGLGWAGLFYLEVVQNVHGWAILRREHDSILAGVVPLAAWIAFVYHAVLFCFLLTAAFCDLTSREIPLSLTVTGTIVGLIGSVLLAWPYPATEAAVQAPGKPIWWNVPSGRPTRFDPLTQPWWQALAEGPREGLYPWPVWGPLPNWLPPGSWQLGLATGLVGLLVGTLLLRAVRFLFSTGLGVEALGLGDADLMMLAGSFLGWQPAVVAFLASAIPGLIFGIIQLTVRRDTSLPFGPALAVGVVITWLGWSYIAPRVQVLFFWDVMLVGVVIVSAVFLFVCAFLLRRTRR
jgi:leader peptidase (prepilin peptidase)/N-methyltransferase